MRLLCVPMVDGVFVYGDGSMSVWFDGDDRCDVDRNHVLFDQLMALEGRYFFHRIPERDYGHNPVSAMTREQYLRLTQVWPDQSPPK